MSDHNILGIVDNAQSLNAVFIVVKILFKIINEGLCGFLGKSCVNKLIGIIFGCYKITALHFQQLSSCRNVADQINNQIHSLGIVV